MQFIHLSHHRNAHHHITATHTITSLIAGAAFLAAAKAGTPPAGQTGAEQGRDLSHDRGEQ
jgi:hypothetical protein